MCIPKRWLLRLTLLRLLPMLIRQRLWTGFLTASLMTAAAVTVKAQEKKVDGGLAVIEDKVIPDRQTPIVPPGAVSLRHFAQHCTGCQLCVSVCPNGVLRPATDLMRLMQPEMSYERGYCRPECTKCSEGRRSPLRI